MTQLRGGVGFTPKQAERQIERVGTQAARVKDAIERLRALHTDDSDFEEWIVEALAAVGQAETAAEVTIRRRTRGSSS